MASRFLRVVPAPLVRPFRVPVIARFVAQLPRGAVYGAPYTNSISFVPAPSVAGDSSVLPPAQSWLFVLTLPSHGGSIECRVHARDTVSTITHLVQERLGSPVKIYSNGKRAESERLLTALFGTAVEFEVGDEKLRYSVNEGLRLSPQGSIVKRTLLRSYVYLATGAAVIAVSCVLFWNTVVPSGHNRLQQMREQNKG
jgi:hypothetical protein